MSLVFKPAELEPCTLNLEPISDSLIHTNFRESDRILNSVPLHESHCHLPLVQVYGQDAGGDGGDEDVLAFRAFDAIHIIRFGLDDFREFAHGGAVFGDYIKSKELVIVVGAVFPFGKLGCQDFDIQVSHPLGLVSIFYAFHMENINILVGAGGEKRVFHAADPEVFQ